MGSFHAPRTPEVIDLEEEADARGYFASDEDDPRDDGLDRRRDGPGPLPVSSRRR